MVQQTKQVRFSYVATNEKGLHRREPLSLWRARQDESGHWIEPVAIA